MVTPRYCERHGTFHSETCDEIDALRAAVVPIHPDQMRLAVDELLDGPKVLCWSCGCQRRLADLDGDGRCSTCGPRVSLEDALAESLRRRGVEPR